MLFLAVGLFMSMVQPSSAMTRYEYEIGRARQAMSVYGAASFRDERVHKRAGKSGSEIETFCATVQYREIETGRVKENGFYWIVRVSPLAGYLSDYQRGAWAGAGPVNEAEFAKLCASNDTLTDTELLRSSEHVLDGSTYDPTREKTKTISRDWLIGSWVYGDSCATSSGETFKSDGSYEGSFGEGQWAILNSSLRLSIIKKEADPSDDRSAATYFNSPKRETAVIERLGYDNAKILPNFIMLRC